MKAKSAKTPKMRVVVKKTTAKKPAFKAKATVKKAAVSKKRPTLTRKVSSKKIKGTKIFGTFCIVSGILCLAGISFLMLSDSIAPIEPAATNNEFVLGASTSVTKPTGLTASTRDGNITISWNKVEGASGYKIWRSSSLFSGMVNIATAPASATYTDTTTQPGKIYLYKVSTVDGTSESYPSAVVIKTASALLAPVGFKISNKSATSMEIQINANASMRYDGFYLYCDKCTEKKMNLDSSSFVTSSGAGGSTTSARTVFYQLNSLKSNTTYTFQLTKYRKFGDENIEGKKTYPIRYVSGSPGRVYAPEIPLGASATRGDAANTVDVGVVKDASQPARGWYVYCDKCPVKKVDISSLSSVGFGRGQYGVVEFYNFPNVPDGEVYIFQIAAYNVVGGRILESPKSEFLPVSFM